MKILKTCFSPEFVHQINLLNSINLKEIELTVGSGRKFLSYNYSVSSTIFYSLTRTVHVIVFFQSFKETVNATGTVNVKGTVNALRDCKR